MSTPEALVPELKPHIMLTFFDFESNGTLDRFNVFYERVAGKRLPRNGRRKKNEQKDKSRKSSK